MKHLVVGAGPVATATVAALTRRGIEATVVSRSGRPVAGARAVAADASDAATLRQLAVGCGAIYNCANPRYDRWASLWPPIAAALLNAAASTGAVLATVSNLYGYGPVAGPLTSDLPLAATFTNGRVRAQMWQDVLAAHEAGRLRATEVRASDFLGPGTGRSSVLGRALPRLAAGRSAFVLGNPDVAHSWTYVGDVGEAVVAAALTPPAHGRPWHVPTATVLTQRQLLSRAAQIAGYRPARLRAATRPLVGALGLVSGEMRAIGDVLYQFQAPFILDAGDAEQVLGVSATPTDVAIAMAVGLEPASAAAAGGAGDERDSAGLSPVD